MKTLVAILALGLSFAAPADAVTNTVGKYISATHVATPSNFTFKVPGKGLSEVVFASQAGKHEGDKYRNLVVGPNPVFVPGGDEVFVVKLEESFAPTDRYELRRVGMIVAPSKFPLATAKFDMAFGVMANDSTWRFMMLHVCTTNGVKILQHARRAVDFHLYRPDFGFAYRQMFWFDYRYDKKGVNNYSVIKCCLILDDRKVSPFVYSEKALRMFENAEESDIFNGMNDIGEGRGDGSNLELMF